MRLTQIAIKSCQDYPSLTATIADYLASQGVLGKAVRHAAIGIANPVIGDQVQMTNHSWAFSIAATQRALGLETLHVMNDFTAMAYALPHLPAETLERVGGVQIDPRAPHVLLGAGTGLGVSGLIPNGQQYAVLAGEGGHSSFSPVNDEEIRLWEFAQQRFGHVSVERLLSGSGLELIDEALGTFSGMPSSRRTAATITALALAGSDVQSCKAVELFCAMLGTVAADIALVLGARGGVYIGGGIVPRLGKVFKQSTFRQRFEAKGRMRSYLAAIPAFVIHTPFPALTGLAAFLDTASAHNPT
jgi:glucokinase